MNQLAQTPQPEYTLTVLSGADKGATYKLGLGRITIGRGSENAIVIKDDPKVSRNHAVLTVTSRGVEISDVSEKNLILVNGEPATTEALKPGSTIQLGGTRFKFNTLSDGAYLDMVVPNPNLDNKISRRQQNKASRSRSANKGLSLNFYIILGALLLLGFFLYNSDSAKKTAPTLLTEEEISKNLSAQTQLADVKTAELEEKLKRTPQWSAAQSQYVRGFRDFQKGQFDRATEAFRACVSLMPEHVMCQTYLETSRRKHAEVIQNQMEFGRKYKDQQQWAACAAAFRNVMVMNKDMASVIYKEAEANRRICELNMRGNF